jgi:hypothetical protein
VTRQLTKSRDFRQNYLHDFFLCIRWRGCETEVFLEIRVVQKSTNYFVTLIIYKRNNLKIVPYPCPPSIPLPHSNFQPYSGLWASEQKRHHNWEHSRTTAVKTATHIKNFTTFYKLHNYCNEYAKFRKFCEHLPNFVFFIISSKIIIQFSENRKTFQSLNIFWEQKIISIARFPVFLILGTIFSNFLFCNSMAKVTIFHGFTGCLVGKQPVSKPRRQAHHTNTEPEFVNV